MPRSPKLVTVAVKHGAVVRRDGRSFHSEQELACTVAEATSFYLAGAAWLPDDPEEARLVRARVTSFRATAAGRSHALPKPEAVKDPRDFDRPLGLREPLPAVAQPIAPPPPIAASAGAL